MNGARTSKSEVIERSIETHQHEAINETKFSLVGDKEHDVLGARAAGLDCVAVAYGYGTQDRMTEANPLKIVDSVDVTASFFSTEPSAYTSRIRGLWRVLYPCGIHFMISRS